MRAPFEAARPEALPGVPLPVLWFTVGQGEVVPARDPAPFAVRPKLKARSAVGEESSLCVVGSALREHVEGT